MGIKRAAIYAAIYGDVHDIDVFACFFAEELDSWFTADVVCCDCCMDVFTKTWPGLATSARFQENGLPLKQFYSGAGFSALYTEEEFLELCRKMGCPKCGEPLMANIWAFSPNFEVDSSFESEINELAAIAKRTPFLVLRHPLSVRVLHEVKMVSADTSIQTVAYDCYRARPISTEQVNSQFLAPPASKCTEGRYNHAGRPVLYLASSKHVAFAELGGPDDGVLIGTMRLRYPQKILDLASVDLPSDILRAITVSALIGAPAEKEGWERPEYTFSRFVADCALDAGFTAIRYPSIAQSCKRGTSHEDEFNLVLFPLEHDWNDVVEVVEVSAFIPLKAT